MNPAAGLYFAGIDVGASSTNCVIIDHRERLCGQSIIPTGANSTTAAGQAFHTALCQAGLESAQVVSTIATGYGRAAVPHATKQVTELTCHAVGAQHLFPATGTVIDIGGQDSKVIHAGPGGKLVDFAMNDKCAAGTGRFLEVMASKLQVALDEMGPLSLATDREVAISSTCTVFAESEVVSLVARNHPREEIIRGLHRAIVNRIMGLLRTVGLHGEVTMSGGVAKNRGVVVFIEEQIDRRLLIYEESQIVGALGAALLAKKDYSGR